MVAKAGTQCAVAVASRDPNAVYPGLSADNIIDAVKPFDIHDGHKGTFLVLRMAGMDRPNSLRAIKRKYRAWQDWRTKDLEFERLDDLVDKLGVKFANEARIIRASMLDSGLVETGIALTSEVLAGHKIPEASWSFLSRLAALRVPVMTGLGGNDGREDGWSRLARILQQTPMPVVKEQELKLIEAMPGQPAQIVATEREIPMAMSKQAAKELKSYKEDAKEIAAAILRKALAGSIGTDSGSTG